MPLFNDFNSLRFVWGRMCCLWSRFRVDSFERVFLVYWCRILRGHKFGLVASVVQPVHVLAYAFNHNVHLFSHLGLLLLNLVQNFIENVVIEVWAVYTRFAAVPERDRLTLLM